MQIQKEELNTHTVRAICSSVSSVSIVKLPARNSKAFAALPRVAQELLHSAHRLQFKLRTQAQAGRMSPASIQATQAGLLQAVTLAELAMTR